MRVASSLRILSVAAPLLGACGVADAQAPSGDSNTFIAERRQDQWLASGLKAKNVYDRSDAKIGVINDLVIGHDGKVVGVVIGVGGFLGIGEKNVGVPFQDIKISMRDNNEWLVLDRSRDDLRAAPAFGTASGPSANAGSDRNYGTVNAPHRAEDATPR
ncbi:MAG: PRC-barrel domain protein [Hyphomicrobiales bacterium]|nr:PRC-barrel domain protein [Hyphomicrobiales bacterium]